MNKQIFKICVVTGTRAEYGLLKPLIEKIDNDKLLDLKIIATGSHYSHKHGLTHQEIEADGFQISSKIALDLNDDTSQGVLASMGVLLENYSKEISKLAPDIILVLGDRYEIFMAAVAATVLKIPIAHIYGGETTEGAFDESFRHSITKMSHIHFTSTETYRQRVIQLGENPDAVINVGSLGVENIFKLKDISKNLLERELGIKLDENTIVVTFHPTTLENETAQTQFQELLNALNFIPEAKILFTKANADPDGLIINEMIDEFVVENRDRAVAYFSLGHEKYLSVIKHVGMVVGNSSSGITEVPSFYIPTINIGDRQKGRVQGPTIINCLPERKSILAAIEKGKEIRGELIGSINPYEKENTSQEIFSNLKEAILNDKIKLKKSFYDVDFSIEGETQ